MASLGWKGLILIQEYVTGVIQIYFSYPFCAEILGLKQHQTLIPNTKQRVCLLLMTIIFSRHSKATVD
jgi:hypothetical protein